MKVAHIVGSLESRYGGPSRSVRRLAAATADLGHDVDLLTSAPVAEPVETEGRLHVRTESLLMPGVGHTITPQGMAAAGAFLRRLWP